MVIEVTYQTKKDAADPNCHFLKTELFEAKTMPERETIAKKLASMGKDFAEETIFISDPLWTRRY